MALSYASATLSATFSHVRQLATCRAAAPRRSTFSGEEVRPIVDLTLNDLTLRAMDEIVNQVAKIHFMAASKLNARMVIKADFNRPENAQSGSQGGFATSRDRP